MIHSWPYQGDDDPWLLKPCDVGLRLGLSRSKVDQMLRAGEIPSMWVGNQRRVKVQDVTAWIAAQAGKPKPAQVERAVARLRKLGVAK